jgi:hypothetical protein
MRRNKGFSEDDAWKARMERKALQFTEAKAVLYSKA